MAIVLTSRRLATFACRRAVEIWSREFGSKRVRVTRKLAPRLAALFSRTDICIAVAALLKQNGRARSRFLSSYCAAAWKYSHWWRSSEADQALALATAMAACREAERVETPAALRRI